MNFFLHDVSFSVDWRECSMIGIATDEAQRRGLSGTELVYDVTSARINDGFLCVSLVNIGEFRVVSLNPLTKPHRTKGLAYVIAAALLAGDDQ